jgi:hypothetical protein
LRARAPSLVSSTDVCFDSASAVAFDAPYLTPDTEDLNPGGDTTLTASLTDETPGEVVLINGSESLIECLITNTGAEDATSVSVEITYDDANFVYGLADGTGWTCNEAGGVITCTMPTLAPGPAAAISISLDAINTGDVLTSTTVSADGANVPIAATDDLDVQLRLVARDATSAIYCPASADQWSYFRSHFGLAAASPGSLWLCQEASGNLADTIGAQTLTAASTPLYQQAVAGWTRLGVEFNSGADGFAAAAGVGPDPGATSVCMVFLVNVITNAATRRIMTIGGSTAATEFALGAIATTGIPRIKVLTLTADGATDMYAAAVIPIVLKLDRTGSTAKAYTDADEIAGTYSALVDDGPKSIGAGGSVSPCLGQFVYGFQWSGTDAELTDANLKAVLEAMGFTIAWS